MRPRSSSINKQHTPSGKKGKHTAQDEHEPFNTITSASDNQDLNLRPLLANITKHPIVFSYDTSFFFCTFSKQVLMYSTTTGEMTHPFYHPAEVVGIVPHANKKELFAFTETGEIYVWDYSDGRLLMTLSSDIKLASVAASRHLSKIYLVGQEGEIVCVNLLQENLAPKTIGNMMNAKAVVSNESGRYVCVMTENSLTLFDTNDGTKRVMKQVRPSVFTCLAIHPSLSIAAVGDSNGSIFLWYFSAESSELSNAPASNLHWHANPVRCLAFTDEGLHLLSAGSEGVVVQWSIEQNKKSFLPRLGSPVEHVSMDSTGKYIAVSLRENFVQLIDALSQTKHVKTLGISVGNKSLKMMTIDPYSKLLVVNGSRGTLQFCDPSSGRPNFELDIVASVNAITGAHGELQLPSISCAGLSPTSTFIVAVVLEGSREILQFLDYDPITKHLSVNTQLATPHGRGMTSGLAIHPSRDLVVTFGSDADFKFWLRDAETKDKQRKYWKCRSVTSYKDLVAKMGSFSPDGSVLAIAHEHVLTLWDSSTLALRGTLSCWPSTDKIKCLAFIPDKPHLVCVTDSGLYVWDLISYSVLWSYNGKISSLGVDTYEPLFAVVEATIGGLLLFESSSPTPLHKVSNVALQDTSNQVLTTFISRFGESSRAKPIVLIGLSDTVLIAEHETIKEKPQVPIAQHARAYKLDPSLPAKVVQPAKKPQRELPALHTGNMALFDTPSHVIPPVSTLFNPFMESLVARKQPTSTPTKQQNGETTPSTKNESKNEQQATSVTRDNSFETAEADASYNSLGSIFKKRKPEISDNTAPKKLKTHVEAESAETPITTPSGTPAKSSKSPAKSDSFKSSETPKSKTPVAKKEESKKDESDKKVEVEAEKEVVPKKTPTKSAKTPSKATTTTTQTPNQSKTPKSKENPTTPSAEPPSKKGKVQPDTPPVPAKSTPTPPPPATPVQKPANKVQQDTPRPSKQNQTSNSTKETPKQDKEGTKSNTPAKTKTPTKEEQEETAPKTPKSAKKSTK